ncbi:Phytosulfokine-beta like [Actinidia chinensis var. chinensis]|uniref:Phytosulfokine n=1 Tax=Actinidia chinensis var. chinensis TaxID=1590841 RepID=A0A2R6S167_ACTCC|nr:Phytosulfokine-beta like [Actinidia chinensis var. chinensis]
MSKSKVTTLLMLALLCSILSCTARPEPQLPNDTPLKTQHGGVEAEVVDESCEGVGDDECLMRRTLAAHVDYIYTQKQKH